MEANRIRLTDQWRFALTEAPEAVQPGWDDSAWRSVDLPHDWQIEQPRREDAAGKGAQGYFPRDHVGVYRLRFIPDDAWQGQMIRVLFDGVQHFSTVYLNGAEVGGRPYGYVPFLCDLTQHLLYGQENVLAVRVDNRANPAWYGAGGDRWYSGAGIYRQVWLLVQPRTHIAHDGVRVTADPLLHGPSGDVPDVAGIRCDKARVTLRVEVEGDAQDAQVHAAIYDRQEQLIYSFTEPAAAAVQHAFLLDKPLLWTPETPALYRAVLRLTRGSTLLDEHTVRFGVRSAVFDEEDGFLLNGCKTKLWGVCLHHDGGAVGAAVPIEVWKRRLTVLKSLGVNTIRGSHNPMAEEMYDLLDEMGFLVIDELYDKWCCSGMYFDAFYDQWHAQDLSAMLRRDANHPSIILWSVGNEVGGQYSETFFRCLEELCAQVRREDPTRSVTAALIGFYLPDYNDATPLGKRLAAVRRYAEIVDVACMNYMEQFYEKLRESGMRKPIIGSEVHTYYSFDDRFSNGTCVALESPYAIVKKHDWVCGAILWAGVDYLGESPFWPLRGWTGNILDSTADIKLRAWYCASQWSNEPILKLAVYDESEPWDGARGMWGFPQMRAHWKYHQFEKILHVAVMTNCDTVLLYQNSQTVRTGYLSDSRDGMVHFYLPYIPGQLRAEGYRGGLLVAGDILYSDHEAAELVVEADRTALPADRRSVAFVDVALQDAHGRRYMLENRSVSWRISGTPVRVLADNGNAYTLAPYDAEQLPLHNGHVMFLLQAPGQPGQTRLHVRVEGFEERTVDFSFE